MSSTKGIHLSLFAEDEVLDQAKAETEVSIVRKKRRSTTKRVTTPTGGSAAQVGVLPGQGFLPGLSRRGRPRSAIHISPVERTAEHRRKRIEAGAKRVEIILDRDISLALDALADHYKEPRSDVIATLIAKAATKVLKK